MNWEAHSARRAGYLDETFRSRILAHWYYGRTAGHLVVSNVVSGRQGLRGDVRPKVLTRNQVRDSMTLDNAP